MRNYRSPKALLEHPSPNIRDVINSLADIWSIVSPFHGTVTANHTTTGNVGHELVISTGSSAITITLHGSPSDGDRATIKQQGTGAVTVDTSDSKTIDGAATISLLRYDAMQVIFTDDADEWSIV